VTIFLVLMALLFAIPGISLLAASGSNRSTGPTFLLVGGLFTVIGAVCLLVAFASLRASARRRRITEGGIAGTDLGPLMSGAAFGQAPGWGQGEQPVASFGVPAVVTSMTRTTIDATGGGDPIAVVSSDQLDQTTLDRINRVLYERSHGMAGAVGGEAAGPAFVPEAQMAAEGRSIDELLDAIGRGQAGDSRAIPSVTGADATRSIGSAGSTGSPDPAPSAGSAGPAAGAGAGVGVSTGFGLLDAKQAERLAVVGYTGRATVESFQDTGVMSGDERLHALQLTVRVDGRPVEQVRHAALVPQRAISRLAVGATLPVRVDPLDASQLVVEWDRG